MLELQSACPFRATAAHRLRAERWRAATLGITPIERGKLVHATLDVFWRGVRTQARLAAMDEATLASSVDAAFDEARAALTPARWASLPPAIAANEKTCVTRLLSEWLHVFERERSPFSVIDTEQRMTVALAGYTLDIRLDRVDALASGGVAVIDYKTGPASMPPRWFEPRPQGMQVALYATAREQAAPDTPVRALVLRAVTPGRSQGGRPQRGSAGVAGLERTDGCEGSGLADWREATSRLKASLVTLTAAFGAGDAAIVPRDRKKVCTVCGLRPLCRIGTLTDDVPPADAELYVDE